VGLAFFWGLVAGSSLLIGGLLALQFRIGPRALGLIMAFGAGVLISAVAYELVLEAAETSKGQGALALGLASGALVFFFGDAAIDHYGGADRKRSHGRQEVGSGLAIVLGIVLDGIPESIVIGLSLLDGGTVGVAVIAAVFLSNLPEAIAATTGLDRAGWARGRILGLWALLVLVTGLSSLAGYGLFGDASANAVAFVLAFAAGAILVMLADTMMPEAFEHGGKLVGLATALGFALAFSLSLAE
jgi:zinc transporter, ZIP family